MSLNCSQPILPSSFESIEEELLYYKNLSIDLEQTLSDTRAGLEEFQASSRELEEELEKEIEQTEKSYGDLKIKTEQLRVEVDDWKGRYQQSKQEHNISMVQMQREVELLRKTEEAFKKKTLELELDNDDLERTERAAMSSLADLEMKYNKAIERNAILENEINIKDQLTEQVQRLKDDLNDANLELERLRAKTDQQQSALNVSESRTHLLETKLANLQEQSSNDFMTRALSPTKQNQLAENGLNTYQKAYVPRSKIPRTPGSPGAGRESNPVRMVQEMVGRVRNLEARLQSCRSLVTPLLQPPPSSNIPIASPALYSLTSPQKQLDATKTSFDGRNSPSSIPTLTNGAARPISPATRAGSPLNHKLRRTSLPMRVARTGSSDDGKMDES